MRAKKPKELVFFEDVTIEEVVLLENVLRSAPNGERLNRAALTWLSERVFELAARGEVISTYSDDAEHALHPEVTDIRSLLPRQRVPLEELREAL